MRALLAVLFLSAQLAPSPIRIIWHGSGSRLQIALTFDAGADRGYAPRILQTLEQQHVRATFGMTGRWALANRDLLRRIARDGDQIINHTYDHQSFTGFSTHAASLSTAQRVWEITQADRVIRGQTGKSTKPYFRPPYGDYDAAALTTLRALGYRTMVMWTLDSLGWEGLPAASILTRCLTGAGPGTILLMHVGSQSQDALALQPLIVQLKRRRYRFVTVAQLLSSL